MDNLSELRRDVDTLMRDRRGFFECNQERDRCICLIAIAFIAYVGYCYYI